RQRDGPDGRRDARAARSTGTDAADVHQVHADSIGRFPAALAADDRRPAGTRSAIAVLDHRRRRTGVGSADRDRSCAARSSRVHEDRAALASRERPHAAGRREGRAAAPDRSPLSVGGRCAGDHRAEAAHVRHRLASMRAITLVCAAIALPRTVAAGAPIHFEPGQPEALPNVKAKAMVATFVDREGTGLGDEMATILGGELLDAVSDVGGAGVIVATNRERSGLSSRLGTNYHRAATEIAREQKTMLAAWGILEDAGPNLRVESYVSQVPNSEVGSIRMQLEWGG